MKKKSLKDIVIPKGTVFDCVDGSKREYRHGNFATIIGLTDDSYGELIYAIDDRVDGTEEWFENVEEE